jgi:hypothetical protein
VAASTEQTFPLVNSFTLPDSLMAVLLTKPGACATPVLLGLVTLTVPFSDTTAASPPLLMAPAPRAVLQITSGATRVARYARESAERGSRQVALGQLEHEGPRMPDQPPAGLEEPLLETRQGPAPDGDGQDEPTQQIAEVVRDDAQRKLSSRMRQSGSEICKPRS